MRFWAPRTLFGRHLLLIAALVVLAEVGMALVYRQAVLEPRLNGLVEAARTYAVSVQAALDRLPASARAGYLASLQESGAASALHGGGAPALTPTPNPLVGLFLRRLEERLGTAYRVGWERGPEPRLWIGMKVAGEPVWVGLRVSSFANNAVARLVLAVALGTGLVALFGAYWIQRRLNRPLRRLAEAAAEVGRGRRGSIALDDAPLEIAQVAASFNQMAADLDAAERERTLMLAGVSHDLRTPLAKLRLAAEILAADPTPDADLIAGMTRNIAVADSIIGQFIDFARVGSDEAERLSDLNEIVREVAAAAGAECVDLDLDELPPLLCRPVALKRAIANLVDNALRYGRPDDAGAIGVRTRRLGERLLVSVSDHGPGIPEDQIARCRQPFTRLESARGGKPGSGLGLAIVERIAHLHHGELRLGNRDGGGLEAVLDLPIRA